MPRASECHFFSSSRNFYPTVVWGKMFSVALELNSFPSSVLVIHRFHFSLWHFFPVLPTETLLLFYPCTCLIVPFPPPSLQAHIDCPLLEFFYGWDFPQSLCTWLVVCFFVLFFFRILDWFTLSVSVSLLNSSFLSCTTFLFHSVICVLDQQLSVWISFINLDVLYFCSPHFFDFFDHSFDFSVIAPNHSH